MTMGLTEPERGWEDSQIRLRCGGFFAVWLDGRPSLRVVPGARLLSPAIPDAVLAAVEEAPRLVADALGLNAARRPWDRLEVSVCPGSRTEGEALPLASGCIRLSLGEETTAGDAARIARHEALHLLLASTLRGGERWCDPDLAFTDWIVRGIEARSAPEVPRLRAPWPGLLDPVPASRVEVQRRLRGVVEDEPAARRYFGDALFAALQRVAQSEPADAAGQRQLWLVEAALGSHYLDAAGRLWTEDADALRPILLDDWLIDYEQYARGVANPPRGAGHLWRMSEGEWSRDVIVRLSVAAQALQRDDHCVFVDGCAPADALVWKNRGRVRLPLVRSEGGPRRAPIEGFRSVLRALEGSEATRAAALIDEAARGAEAFEARALWPRILARLLAADFAWPEVAPAAVPAVRIVDAPQAEAPWRSAADALRSLLGERGAWVPRVLASRPASTLSPDPDEAASVLLVFGAPPDPGSLLEARSLATRIPVRGAVFFGDGGRGAAYESLPDLAEPLDPRYREEPWSDGATPASLADLARLSDEATAGGRPTSPLSWLLSISAIGLEECHYPRAPARAPSPAQS